MQISLRLRLDTATDRFVVELEPGAHASERDFPVEYCKEPGKIQLDKDGYVLGFSMPGLKLFFEALAGKEKPGK